jgi:hypothetical protein
MIVIAEVIAGIVGGLILGAAAGFVGRTLGGLLNNGWGDLVGALVLGAVGYVIGAAIGAAFIRRRLTQTGSWGWALAGSLVSAGLVLLLAQPLRLNESPVLLQGVFVILPPVGAMLALQLRAARRTAK